MRHSFLASALLFCSPMAAQVATPVIHSGLVAGSSRIQGSFSKPSGSQAVSLKLFVDGAEAAPKPRVLIDMEQAEFTMELAAAWKGGERAAVQQTAPQESGRSPEKRVPAIPKVGTDLVDGSREVTFTAVPGSPAVTVVVTDSAATSTLQSKDTEVPKTCSPAKPEDCKVIVKLDAALAEGQRVLAREKGGDLSEAVKVKAKADSTPYTPSLVSVESYYGASKIKIFFQKLSDKVEKATAVVTTCLEQKSYSFTDDDLKATSVEVPLARGMFCTQAAGADKKVELRVTMKAGAASKPAEQTFPALTPDLMLTGRLMEGQGKLSGKAGPTISSVRVVVYSGWTSDEASESQLNEAIAKEQKKKADLEEDKDKTSKDKSGDKVTKTSKLTLDIKTVERRIISLEQRLALLSENGGTASKVAFSPAGATGALDNGHAGIRCLSGDVVQEVPDLPVANGTFTATLTSRLNAGDCVVAIAEYPLQGSAPVPPKGEQAPSSSVSAGLTGVPYRLTVSSAPVVAQSSILDWGRLRAYFTVGGAISHNREQFSRTDTFIGFTGDARLVGEVLDKRQPGASGPIEFKKFRWHVNAFLDARVSVRLAESGQGQQEPTTATRTLAANSPLLTPQLNFNSTQPGYALMGLHVPLSYKGMDWQHKGQSLSFFVGPIGRLGGQTQGSDTVVYRNLYTHPFTLEGRQVTAFTINREETRSGVLPIYQFGTRFGIFKYDLLGDIKRQRQVANDLVAYLDIVWGRSYAFRSYQYRYTFLRDVVVRAPDGTERTTQVPEVRVADNFQFIQDPRLKEVEISSRVRPRFYVEGRLKIPNLPALIGIDYSVRTNARDYEPNELRFVLAFRIDAQKALGRVFRNSELQNGF